MTSTKRFALAIVLPLLAAAAPVGGVAVTAAVEEGCATAQPILSTLPALSACIASVALSDIVEAFQDPLQLVNLIISSCSQYGTATVESIIQVIESLLAGQPAVDSGAGLSGKQLARLNKVHAAAILQQHITIPPSASVPNVNTVDAPAQ